MNKSSNNINEEINRIKSLFTEERMYGNMVKEGEGERKESFHDNGKLKTQGTIKDGLSHGEWKQYYENGQLHQEGKYENGHREGEWKYYHRDNGQLYQEGKFVKGEREGEWKFYRDNGQLRAEGKFVKGEMEGECKFYYENGQLYQEGKFVKGEREGEWKHYYENGQLEKEGKLVKGEKEGEWKYYLKDGNVDKIVVYEDGELVDEPEGSTGCIKGDCENGEGTYMFGNGIVYVGEFKDGSSNGQGTYTYTNGDKYVGEFKDGNWHGQGTWIWANGDKEEVEYKDGEEVEIDKTNTDDSDGTDEVEVFKDKGGKYHYAKLPDGTYWYSTDGSNWKQQTTQKGMDAIEERINSDKVDSLGNVKISSIDSSYVESGDSNGSDEVDTTVDSEEEAIERITPKPVKTFDTDIEDNIGDDVVANFGTGNPEEVVVDESDVTFKGCKKRLTSYIKLAKDGTSMEDAFGDEIDEKEKDIRSCLGKYYNKFEKIGFMKKGKGVYLLKKLWDIDYERNIDGGIEGQKYEIIVNNRSRGKVKRVGKNEYRVISKPNETIFGRDKNFRDGFEEAVFNSLDLPSDENDLIVAGIIQKGPIQWAKLLRKDV